MSAGEQPKSFPRRENLNPPPREDMQNEIQVQYRNALPSELQTSADVTPDTRDMYVQHLIIRAEDFKSRYHKRGCDPGEKAQNHLYCKLRILWLAGEQIAFSFGIDNHQYDDLILKMAEGKDRAEYMEEMKESETSKQRTEKFDKHCHDVDAAVRELASRVRQNASDVQAVCHESHVPPSRYTRRRFQQYSIFWPTS